VLLARVRAVADYQFGKGAADLLLDGQVELKKSETTGKIRNVLVDKEHVLSMRANDGFFTLRPPGAVRLKKGFAAPKLRVVVKDDAIPFNREGKNVFSAFVQECDPEVRPMDEVLVVDSSDELVALGRALLTREEMLAFRSGIAVKVREGIKL
jgi:7-cyano-7-deazaguanine tRNA-ribosyltransferase